MKTRDVCIENFSLHPNRYHTLTGLAWYVALKITEVRLKLLSDPDMLLMVEKGIRGVAMTSHRYGKTNNPYMGDKYDKTEPSKYLVYLDANNLYRWAMQQELSTHVLNG